MINDKIGTLYHQDLPQQEEECVVYCVVLLFAHLLAVKNNVNFPLMARIFMKRSLEKQNQPNWK
jgi:hypothetical protein